MGNVLMDILKLYKDIRKLSGYPCSLNYCDPKVQFLVLPTKHLFRWYQLIHQLQIQLFTCMCSTHITIQYTGHVHVIQQ